MSTKLYNYFRSSCSYRVRIALNLKQIPYEYVGVHLLKDGGQHKLPEFIAKNPMGQVPVLEHEERFIAQSMAILLYLEDFKPEPRLFGRDLVEKTKILEVCEMINSGIQPLQNLGVLDELTRRFGADFSVRADWCNHWITKGLKAVESFLSTHAGEFAFGNQVSAADCLVVPQLHAARRFNVNLELFPTLLRIEKNALSLDAFKLAEPSLQPDANV